MLACGKKATDLWIATMIARLPDTPCQHGSFTMPDTLWPLFEVNRWLLSGLFALPKVIMECASESTVSMGVPDAAAGTVSHTGLR